MHEVRTGTRMVGKHERTHRNINRCHGRILENDQPRHRQSNRYNPSGLYCQRTDQCYVGYRNKVDDNNIIIL